MGGHAIKNLDLAVLGGLLPPFWALGPSWGGVAYAKLAFSLREAYADGVGSVLKNWGPRSAPSEINGNR